MGQRKSAKGRRNHHRRLRQRVMAQALRRKALAAVRKMIGPVTISLPNIQAALGGASLTLPR